MTNSGPRQQHYLPICAFKNPPDIINQNLQMKRRCTPCNHRISALEPIEQTKAWNHNIKLLKDHVEKSLPQNPAGDFNTTCNFKVTSVTVVGFTNGQYNRDFPIHPIQRLFKICWVGEIWVLL